MNKVVVNFFSTNIKNRLFPFLSILLTVSLISVTFIACSTDSVTVTPSQCSPSIYSIQDIDELTLLTTDEMPSTSSGMIRISGLNFFPVQGSDDIENPYIYNDVSSVSVSVADTHFTIIRAYEQTLPDITYKDSNLDSIASTCATCATCEYENDYGCGGCESACSGCEQVLELSFPNLYFPQYAQNDATSSSLPISVISSAGFVTAYSDFILSCFDGIDNDSDTYVDEDDLACDYNNGWSELFSCNDGVDNDLDGFSDLSDSACMGDNEYFSEKSACSDGIDNDLDGFIDIEDLACSKDPYSLSETEYLMAPACNNGLDDDLDGLIDSADTLCLTGIDNTENAQ